MIPLGVPARREEFNAAVLCHSLASRRGTRSLVVDVAEPRGDRRGDAAHTNAQKQACASPVGQVNPAPADRGEDRHGQNSQDEVAHERAVAVLVVRPHEVDDAADGDDAHGEQSDQSTEGLEPTELVDELTPAKQDGGDEHGQDHGRQQVKDVLRGQGHVPISLCEGWFVNGLLCTNVA